MSLEIKILNETNSKEWDDVVSSSPHGTIFHTWKWLNIVERHSDSKFYPLAVYSGQNIAAIYPIFVQKKRFINNAFSPPFGADLLYLGPVIAEYERKKQDKKESLFTEIQHEVDKYLSKNLHCQYTRITLSPGLFDSRPLRWCGYTVEPNYTYRINLQEGKDKIWNQFHKKIRQSIHKSQKEGIIVTEGNRDDISKIEDELLRRRGEQGIVVQNNIELLMELYDNYKDHMRIILAYHQEKLSGSAIVLIFKDMIYGWVGSPKSELKGIYPNHLIQWEIIQWACDHGFHWYDIMDKGDIPELTLYKSQFNPEPFIWFTAEKYSSVIYRIGVKLMIFIRFAFAGNNEKRR